MIEEIHRADVICIVYSVDDDATLKQVHVHSPFMCVVYPLVEYGCLIGPMLVFQGMEYWLPYIRQILGDDHKRPVVLVGNRTDLTDKSTLDVSTLVHLSAFL